ncbi:glycoside hydrolase family 20 zincin-like fold domain-containing protein [Bacteroides bouchesdurhonensis]|uniref:glycoside hydrolase family 20 zincin-like fold domain-containing protein n=1 Tax=Bacteroides bouchesdurhonensis TaxID=1841855 RepID=UPI0009F9181C
MWYRIHSIRKGIAIGYGNKSRIFYGLQTLKQLVRKNGTDYAVPYITISDQPPFLANKSSN